MPATEYRMEQRARLLAGAIQGRVEMLRQAVAPPGKRPPFSKQLTHREALAWWRRHRYDDLGWQALEAMQPEAILELDQALASAIEAEQAAQIEGGSPWVP